MDARRFGSVALKVMGVYLIIQPFMFPYMGGYLQRFWYLVDTAGNIPDATAEFVRLFVPMALSVGAGIVLVVLGGAISRALRIDADEAGPTQETRFDYGHLHAILISVLGLWLFAQGIRSLADTLGYWRHFTEAQARIQLLSSSVPLVLGLCFFFGARLLSHRRHRLTGQV